MACTLCMPCMLCISGMLAMFWRSCISCISCMVKCMGVSVGRADREAAWKSMVASFWLAQAQHWDMSMTDTVTERIVF
ncbi:MAG: hypothetical protein K2P65_11855 [Lachnospiraceae bacterium]|nr:hypothetical protein [Lachnospiraceae bacterium]